MPASLGIERNVLPLAVTGCGALAPITPQTPRPHLDGGGCGGGAGLLY